MKEAKETILRQWSMLRRIPRHPGSVGTRELKDKLEQEGFLIDVRTIQRDLEKLSGLFPLSCETRGKANRWFWMEEATVMDLPGMEPATAVAFRLAEEYLAPLLPNATIKHLEPHFRRAREILKPERGTRLAVWPDKVQVIAGGPALTPPSVKPEVQEAVYRALLEDRQLVCTYRSKDAVQPKSYPINPLGLVFRDGVVYLVGTAKDYAEVRHFALHRMEAAMMLETPCRRPPGFNFQTYVKAEQLFAYPLSRGPIDLELAFDKGAAVHLTERLLSKDQRVTQNNDGRVMVRATVKDTLELRWWLLGFGDKVEVLAPQALRHEFSAIARRMAHRYGS